jgi:2-iminobutanoate/2-iminopropanoate deaminase
MSNLLTIYRRFTSRARWAFVGAGLAGMALSPSSAGAQTLGEIQKLGYDGQPVTGKGISPVVVHNGIIYVSGQGANEENESVQSLDITTQVQRAMNNVKKLVEGAGGDMDHVLTLTVYLASLELYEAMNKAYRPFFPNRGPARCTISVTGIPGNSLVEMSCIAEVVRHS